MSIQQNRSEYYDPEFSLRDEKNGITVHESRTHLFTFYEGLSTEAVLNAPEGSPAEFLKLHKERITQNVAPEYPYFIGWLVSGSCNLDCIYCFADDKIHIKNTENILDTAKHLLTLHPLCVGFSGGEPTLNPQLPDVLRFFRGKVHTVLDTNGTTDRLRELIPVLKETGTLVRLTVDTLDNDLLNTLRPPRSPRKQGYNQAALLTENIRLLVENGVPLIVHTVLTRKNIGMLDETAERLISLGVKRWYFYPVSYAEKCSSFFDEIKVSHRECSVYCEQLRKKCGDRIVIAFPENKVGFRERATLLVDSLGRFCVDTVTEGTRFIGSNPLHPTISEIRHEMNFEIHKVCYLTNFW